MKNNENGEIWRHKVLTHQRRYAESNNSLPAGFCLMLNRSVQSNVLTMAVHSLTHIDKNTAIQPHLAYMNYSLHVGVVLGK